LVVEVLDAGPRLTLFGRVEGQYAQADDNGCAPSPRMVLINRVESRMELSEERIYGFTINGLKKLKIVWV
jgi:hypothetical protein